MNHKNSAPEPISAIEHWNQRYAEKDRIWSGKANAALISAVSEHPPGTALDVGCGEGGDSVWLAERGWTVTGVDVSTTALERAQQAADARGLNSLTAWKQVDLTQESPEGLFDLVSAVFLQSQIEFPREDVHRKLTENVAPGGLFLVVGHAEWPPWARDASKNTDHDHEHPELPSAAETLAFLELTPSEWDVLLCTERSRIASGPDGAAAELLDAVVLVRRIP